MTPHLTASGRTVLVAATTLILVGVAASQWPILLLGECLAVLLTAIYYLQIPRLMAVEEGFVRIGLRPADGVEASGVAGRPVTLAVEVLNRANLVITNVLLVAEHDGGLELEPDTIELAALGPRETLSLRVQVTARAAGRHLLHGFRLRADGLTGLVAVSDYLPASLPLKFLPRAAGGRQPVPQPTRRTTDVQRMGAHLLRRRGFGSDFRELRDHAIGDPFRSIAWKATARTGKLMVREFEEEVIANAFVLLDISSTMRGGTPPRTKLQHAVDLTAELATSLARSHDRLGLITFDEVVYGHVRTNAARSVLPHVVNHLVGLTSVVDPDFTELDDDEVVAALVRYLMVQERLDFRRQPSKEERLPGEIAYDTDLLSYWVGKALSHEEERLGDRCIDAGIVNAEDLDPLRRFCQLRGVPVPYRLEARFGAKEMGMVQALERFLEENRESHFVLLVSDLCGLVDTSEIVRALRLVLQRKHRVLVLMPYTPAYVDTGDAPGTLDYERARVLREIFCLAERRERARIARSISALGIPVMPAGPEDSIRGLMARV